MTLLETGIANGYVSLNEDGTSIIYIHQKKKRNYTNPEEKVQAEAFLKLLVNYGYDPDLIDMYVSVTMGSGKKEADIIVYNDLEHKEPFILVECKKQDVSEAEFQQAINQAYSYAFALPNDIKYIWITSGLKDEYFKVDKQRNSRSSLSDIPHFGQDTLSPYKYIYSDEANNAGEMHVKSGQQFSYLTKITEDELTRLFKQAHNALWGGGQLNPSEAFDELDKLIFCKIWDEKKPRKNGEPFDFQIWTIDEKKIKDETKRTEKENQELAERIHRLYDIGKTKDAEVFRDNIRLTPEKIRTVVGYLQGVNLGETDLDAKGKAFEVFMDSFFRGNFGQFFTPRPIVKFITDVLPITNDSKVLDTSCGSGGFLLYALDKVRKQAEEVYPLHKTNKSQIIKYHEYWHNFAQYNLFGIEINEQISRTAKMNMIIHDDGHTNVVTTDGLDKADVIQAKTGNAHFKYGTFDFVITNPPFGSAVKLTEHSYLNTYHFGQTEINWLDIKNTDIKDRDTQSTEICFIEKAHMFLKEGGYLGIVIPDGILTNSSLQYIRNNIEEWYRIIAVVSMPQTAFMHTGAGVKSSVLFLRKWPKTESKKISDQKRGLQNKIKEENNYIERIETIEKEKKECIKNHIGFVNMTDGTDKKNIESSEAFKAWKAEQSEAYNQKITALKDELTEQYEADKKRILTDYPIFMAIAEDIGYDATGRKTGNNELDIIGAELEKFIKAVEAGNV